MKTEKQEELIHSFLLMLDEEHRPVYHEIISFSSEVGYNPKKQRSNIVFNHDQHNKQMAKIGINPKNGQPFFALRFSACKGYSRRFMDIVRDAVSKENFREALCLKNGCHYCRGEAADRVYTYILSTAESRSHCGEVALEIPNITEEDIAEIKMLILEEHRFLLRYEAGEAP